MTDEFDRLIQKYPELESCRGDLEGAYQLLRACFQGGGKLLACGNGGSAADSEHIVGELMKGFLQRRPLPDDLRRRLAAVYPEDGAFLADHLQGALPAISLVNQVALNTAFANDVAPEMVFAQQVYGHGRPGDVLLEISTSGNALNVLRAAQVARVLGLKTLGLSGMDGGKLRGFCDVTICVPWTATADIQERHLPVIHALCAKLENEFFGS
jgi:D-sedoheptulose 7-phosphate isomerase